MQHQERGPPPVRGGVVGSTSTKNFSVPYRDRRPLSGPLYRLVASARSRGYHSGRFSISAGPSILRGSWRPRRGAPATGAAGETRVCADGWALWVTGRCATPIKTEHLEIPSGRGRPPRRPLPAEVSSLGPEDAHAAANALALLRADRALGNTEGEGGCPPRACTMALAPASQRIGPGGRFSSPRR